MSVDPQDLTFGEKIDYIRGSLTPLDIVEMAPDVEVIGSKIRSPWNPDERTPSCHLWEDGFYDFSTGKGGDVLDLYMKLADVPLQVAVRRLLEGSFRIEADPDRVVRTPLELPDLTSFLIGLPMHSSAELEKWNQKLGCSMIDVRGDGERVYIPHWHDGRVRGIKLRTAWGDKSAVPGSTFAVGLYWPGDIRKHPEGATTLYITEGETDAWTLLTRCESSTVHVASLPSGAGLWKDAWLPSLEQYQTIYTAFDNDRAGRQATEKVRNSIGWGRWKELAVPTLYKDVREAVNAGWKPELRQ